MAKYRCKLIKMALTIYLEIPLDKNMQHSKLLIPLNQNISRKKIKNKSHKE